MKNKKGKIIGIALLLVALPLLFSGGAAASATENLTAEISSEKQSKSLHEVKELVIPVKFSPNSITALEGATGKISVDKFEGVELKGTFKEIKNNPVIEMKKDGVWTAKKTGATKIVPEFELSADTVKELEKKYPETTFRFSDVAQVINVRGNPKSIQIPISFSPGTITAIEGEAGQLSIDKFEGIELKGTFKEIHDNPFIGLEKDGQWVAKQTGTTEIIPEFELSAETLKELEKRYPGVEFYLSDIAQVINVKINPEVLQIPIDFSPRAITAIEGETGQLSVGRFEGIELKGTFKEITDNPIIEVTKDGVWKAKQIGTTTFVPEFELSAETLNKIKKLYAGSEIQFSDIAQVISVKVDPAAIQIPINFSPGSIAATEGETGQLSVGDFEGIELKGTFKEIKDNQIIELTRDGEWTAKQAGTTEIVPEYELSTETLNELKKKYPGRDLQFRDLAQVITVTVNEHQKIPLRNNAAPTTQVKQVSGKKAGKILPKTGDSTRNTSFRIIGFVLLFLSVTSFWLIKEKQKKSNN